MRRTISFKLRPFGSILLGSSTDSGRTVAVAASATRLMTSSSLDPTWIVAHSFAVGPMDWHSHGCALIGIELLAVESAYSPSLGDYFGRCQNCQSLGH